jgi:hypothetical protein
LGDARDRYELIGAQALGVGFEFCQATPYSLRTPKRLSGFRQGLLFFAV